MAGKTTWDRSVERARLATTKSFEGRMEAAAASFEQIPPNGAGAGKHTLGEFAEAAGINYSSLTQYRNVWDWVKRDLAYVRRIGNYSLAYEAKNSKRWFGAPEFIAFIESTPPPIFEEDGYEPYRFTSWGVDALRVYLGKRPTNVALSLMTAKDSEPDPDEVKAAIAEDTFEEAAEKAGEVKKPRNARKVADAAKTSSKKAQQHDAEISGSEILPPEPAEPVFASLVEVTGDLAQMRILLRQIADRAQGHFAHEDRVAIAESLRTHAGQASMVAEFFERPESMRLSEDDLQRLQDGGR